MLYVRGDPLFCTWCVFEHLQGGSRWCETGWYGARPASTYYATVRGRPLDIQATDVIAQPVGLRRLGLLSLAPMHAKQNIADTQAVAICNPLPYSYIYIYIAIVRFRKNVPSGDLP